MVATCHMDGMYSFSFWYMPFRMPTPVLHLCRQLEEDTLNPYTETCRLHQVNAISPSELLILSISNSQDR